jgi:AAA family ATPase
VNISLVDAVRGEIGSGEKRIRELFAEAKRSAPSIIFIDEFQAMFTSREEGVASASDVGATLTVTLSGCFDDLSIWNRYSGLESLFTVVASTNEPWAIDRSFLRPQRLQRCLFMGGRQGGVLHCACGGTR